MEDDSSGWPLLGRLRASSDWLPVAIYLGQIGPSGRASRPTERRIQNPASCRPILPDSARLPLLIGLSPPDGQETVLVAWDAGQRLRRSTRYSAFLDQSDLQSARVRGLNTRLASNGERILAFTPNQLGAALDALRGDFVPMDEEELDLEGLSEVLATLSEGQTPNSFSIDPTPFEADEVDWETNGWLASFQEVQDWLVLDERLDLGGGPAQAATDLFLGLGAEAPDSCFAVTDGVAHLNGFGFTKLEDRLSRAQKAKAAFEQDLSDGIGLAQATRRWKEIWEDEVDTAAGTVEVHAEVDTWKIRDFKEKAEAGRLELNPSYQRDVVWSNSDSQKLVDSVLRGIPLPSIILNKRRDSRVHEIVDGKQRLTALLRFMGKHPEGVAFAKRMSTPKAPFELYESNYRKWRRALGIKSSDERKHCLPFNLPTYDKGDTLEPLSRKYYCEIVQEKVTIQGAEEEIEEVFDGTSKAYLIPVIVYKDTDLDQIHKVFGLYNKQGKQLNAEELRNAIFHELDLTRLMLAISGDGHDPSGLVAFADQVSMGLVPDMLHELQVGSSRFHRTKIVSWVAAVMLHAPKRGPKGIMTPSTAGFIDGLLKTIATDRAHPMREIPRLITLGNALSDGATFLNELRAEEEAFAPSFTHKKSEGARWEDLPAVAAWTACTLATIGGLGAESAPEVCDRVRAATEFRSPLNKQQSSSQWGYIARTVLELLEAMEVDLDHLDSRLGEVFGFSCLATLKAVDSLNIALD